MCNNILRIQIFKIPPYKIGIQKEPKFNQASHIFKGKFFKI